MPYRVFQSRVEPFWLRFSRLVVRRLPGMFTNSTLRSRGSLMQLLSWACPPLQGTHPGQRCLPSGCVTVKPSHRGKTHLPGLLSLSSAWPTRHQTTGLPKPVQARPVHCQAFGGPTLARVTSSTLPGLFRPDSTPELLPFRALILPEIRDPLPDPILPCRFRLEQRTFPGLRLRRFVPSGNRAPDVTVSRNADSPCPPGRSGPSLRFSLLLPRKPVSRFLPLSSFSRLQNRGLGVGREP